MDKFCAASILGLTAQSWFKILVRASTRDILFEDDLTGVRIPKKVILPPRSQSVVSAILSQSMGGENVIIKPFFLDASVLVANTIDHVRSNVSISCLIANLDKSSIELPANLQLGCFEVLGKGSDQTQTSITARIQTIPSTNEHIQIGDQLSESQVKDLDQLLLKHKSAFSIDGKIGDEEAESHQHRYPLQSHVFKSVSLIC